MSENLKGLFGGGEAGDAPSAAQKPAKAERRGGGGGGGRRRRQQLSGIDTDRAEDFINRYTSGHPSEGFDSEEAVTYLRQIRGEVPPEVLQRAAVATVQNLPDDQRKAFAEMLQRRQQGSGMVTIERTGAAREAQGRGAAQPGGDIGMDDMLGGLFGSLFGGGMAQPAPQQQPQTRQDPGGMGMDDMLGGLLGSLLGGGGGAPQGRNAPGSDPFGDILGSILGGDAALPSPEPTPRERQQPQAQGGGIGDILGSPLGKAVLGGIAAFAMKEMMDKSRKG
jgi:hypothetical protein